MQILLLSGGSGKRLWPLSNAVRSKQFLRFLPAPGGGLESMIQRVMRQIGQVGLEGRVTVSSNSVQLGLLRQQLPSDVDLVLEPSLRGTFPAIALSAAYMSLQRGLDDREVVAVMPSDPYTQPGYFSTIHRMAGVVQRGEADLALMGIRPDGPSEKYGYILPLESSGDCLTVQSFKEKPDRKTAQHLILNGALWNGGVFCFRLGYVMDMLRSRLAFSTYDDVLAQYDRLPIASFDCEVVEKATGVKALVYEGEWTDLGTWDAFTSRMDGQALGNVTFGQDVTGCRAVNELPQPLLLSGVENLAVAASADGILVTSLEDCGQIRSLAETVGDAPRTLGFQWGRQTVLDRPEGLTGPQTSLLEVQDGIPCLLSHTGRGKLRIIALLGMGRVRLEGKDWKAFLGGDELVLCEGMSAEVLGEGPMRLLEVRIPEEGSAS